MSRKLDKYKKCFVNRFSKVLSSAGDVCIFQHVLENEISKSQGNFALSCSVYWCVVHCFFGCLSGCLCSAAFCRIRSILFHFDQLCLVLLYFVHYCATWVFFCSALLQFVLFELAKVCLLLLRVASYRFASL